MRYFWITHSYLVWKHITHCLLYNALLQMGLLFVSNHGMSNLMQTLILTLQENIFDVHHLVDFPMTVDNMTVANVSHSASMTHSCMHHSTINFDPHHAACQVIIIILAIHSID